MHGVKDVFGAASATALLCALATMTTTRNACAIPSTFLVLALGRARSCPATRNNPSSPRESVVYELSRWTNPLGAQAAPQDGPTCKPSSDFHALPECRFDAELRHFTAHADDICPC